jgi:hypothetical protein
VAWGEPRESGALETTKRALSTDKALPGRPAGQGFAQLVLVARAIRAHAASMSAGVEGRLRASTPFFARCLRIAPITLGSVMNAMMRIVPPQRGHTNGSTS